MTDVTEIRIGRAEEDIADVKSDIGQIKDTLHSIDKEIRQDLTKLSTQFSDFTQTMQGLAIRSEEREKRTTEIFVENKTTFERFGNKIDILDNRLVEHAKTDITHSNKITSLENKLANLEKLLYGGLSTIGAVVAWLVQYLVTR